MFTRSLYRMRVQGNAIPLFSKGIVSDSFNRADSATSLGIADTGQAWVPAVSTWGINSNRAYCPGLIGIAVIESGRANCTVSALAIVGSTDFGLYFRYADANNWWRFVFSGTSWFLQKNVAGSTTTVDNPAGTLAANDTVAVVLSGSSIIGKQNGAQISSASDAFNASATQHGMGTASSTSTQRWDNFSVVA